MECHGLELVAWKPARALLRASAEEVVSQSKLRHYQGFDALIRPEVEI